MKNKVLDFFFGVGPTKPKVAFWVFQLNLNIWFRNLVGKVVGPVGNVVYWKSPTNVPFQGDYTTLVTFRKKFKRYGIYIGGETVGYIVNGDETMVYPVTKPYEAVLSYRNQKTAIDRCSMLAVQIEQELDLMRKRRESISKRTGKDKS